MDHTQLKQTLKHRIHNTLKPFLNKLSELTRQNTNRGNKTEHMAQQHTMPSEDKKGFSIKVGEMEIEQGFNNQFAHSIHIKDTANLAENTSFESFCMQMVKVGQLNVLQAILTYPKERKTTTVPMQLISSKPKKGDKTENMQCQNYDINRGERCHVIQGKKSPN